MIERIRSLQLRHHYKVWNDIWRSPLPVDVKRTIRQMYLQAVILRKHDAPTRSLDAAGYTIRYCTHNHFLLLFQEIFLDHSYHFVTSSRTPRIVDCGSNIGMAVVYFKLLFPDSQILAFEPDHDAFGCLVANIENNDIHSVTPANLALAETDGEVDFFFSEHTPGSLTSGIVRQRSSVQCRKVRAVRLSDHVDGEVDFLKIDVEGSELGIVRDLCLTGKIRYVSQMAIEYHHHINADEDTFSTILGHLENAGFGYQIGTRHMRRPLAQRKFQDIFLYAYRK